MHFHDFFIYSNGNFFVGGLHEFEGVHVRAALVPHLDLVLSVVPLYVWAAQGAGEAAAHDEHGQHGKHHPEHILKRQVCGRNKSFLVQKRKKLSFGWLNDWSLFCLKYLLNKIRKKTSV